MVKRFISALACFACVATGGIALSACGKKATVVETEDQFIEAVAKGGSVQLGKNITLTKALTISKDVTIDLNNKNINETYEYDKSKNDTKSMFRVDEGGSLTVKGEGKVASNDLYIFWLNGSEQGDDAHLSIEGGSYTADCSVVYVTYGSAEVKGGDYKIENSAHPEYIKYMLNLKDENGKAGKASIVVTGGSFTGYNPADSRSEGEPVSFVKEGYQAKEAAGVYTVTKKK